MAQTKGEQTKNYILDKALDLASVMGLDKISVGDLAKATELSRSGLFAHFQSKEQLQLEILKWAEASFMKLVIEPTQLESDPLQKLELLKRNWPGWEERSATPIRGGCLFLAAIFEFDDQPGAVRDYLVHQQQRLIKYIGLWVDECQKQKRLSKNVDKIQFAYEFYSFYMGYHYYKRLFDDGKAKARFNKAVDTLIENSRA